MKSASPFSPRLRGKVMLIGYDPEGRCVHTALLSSSAYYDGDHPWDSDERTKAMRLRTLRGYVFNDDGTLAMEFERLADLETGAYESGWSRDENGVVSAD